MKIVNQIRPQPTQEEIATRKRLRLICQWFQALNDKLAQLPLPEQGLPMIVVAKITAQNFDPADLIAIRNMPGKWTLSNIHNWLWILHRYQNHFTSLHRVSMKGAY